MSRFLLFVVRASARPSCPRDYGLKAALQARGALGLSLSLLLLVCNLLAPHAAQAAPEEDALVAVLQSDKGPGEKAAACRSLKTVGTAKSVPALAALLTDKEVSHSARYALESMPCPEAGAALREALGKAAGLTKAGIIDSIGERRDKEAVPLLAPLAGDADPQVASSAAAALGKLGGAEAAQALRAAQPKAPAAVRLSVADALLLCADRLRAAGDAKAASAIYREQYDSKAPEHIRTAAYRGLVLAAGDDAASLVAKGLAGSDRAARLASLQLVREIKGEAATRAFAALLPKLEPKMQVALLEGMSQRGDKGAGPAVAAAVGSPEPAVRLAALGALVALGDASAVPLLADAAAKAQGPEQDAARHALARLRGAGITEAILAHLAKAKPEAPLELARALGLRRDAAAVPALLKMADGGDESARTAALRSLALLADEAAAADLVRLLVQAKTEGDRDAAEKALVAACGRSARSEATVAPVLVAMGGAAVPVRCALLRAAGRIGGAEALKALRAAVADKDPAIQDAAVRTMADAAGLEAAPDLLKLAREAASPAHRVLALRGYWRLAALAADRPAEERWNLCAAGLAAAKRPEDEKLGLTELAKVPHLGALKLAESMAVDQAVKAEAEAAAVRIAASLGGSHPAEARAALQRVAAATGSDAVRAEAQKALDAMDQFVGYIPAAAWLVAGPYRQQGKECGALFDVAFPPETAADAAKVAWKPAPQPADPSLAWQVDLGSVVAGDQCVVYLKTCVESPREARAKLEIGSDDGAKLWVNGKLVHAHNVMRPLVPGQDKAEAVLKQGWNDFLLKVTQNNMGCGFCIRVRNADGSVLDGLRSDPAGAK